MSTKVWYCGNCGYEVNVRGRCFSCGARLIASPLPELESGPEDDEVGYRLDQWDDPTRAGLIRELLRVGIFHRFEDDELVVLATDEPEVDRIVARVTGNAAGDDDDDGEGLVPSGNAGPSAELYDAARRLREDPTDMPADAALSEASALLFASDYLANLDDEQLAAVGRVTRRLLGALGADEAMEDEIRHQAEVLCRLIAPSAGEEQTQMELARARARLEASAKSRGRLVELPQSEVTPGGEMSPAGDLGGEAGADAEDGAGLVESIPGASASATSGPGLGQAASGAVGGRMVPPLDEVGEDDLDDGTEEEDEDTGELVFELGEWLPEQRIELSLLLEAAGIAYNWDGPDLTVAEERETEVEALFTQIHGLADDDDEARYRAIEELFGSVDRLANDPDNQERRQAFLNAVGAVDFPTPVGVDDTYWWRIRTQGHALVAAVEHDRTDEVARDAALLAEMLHEMV